MSDYTKGEGVALIYATALGSLCIYWFSFYFLLGSVLQVQDKSQIPSLPIYKKAVEAETGRDLSVQIYLSSNLPFMGKLAVGVCYKDFNTVLIKKRSWEEFNLLERWYIILHEIGHCSFDLEHNDTTKSKFATSIMHPYFLDKYRPDFFFEYWNRFFSKIKG